MIIIIGIYLAVGASVALVIVALSIYGGKIQNLPAEKMKKLTDRKVQFVIFLFWPYALYHFFMGAAGK